MGNINTKALQAFLELSRIEYKVDVAKQALTGMLSDDIIPVVAYPDTLQKFEQLIFYANDNSLTFEVIGALTNTYLAEGFKRDILVKTIKMNKVFSSDAETVVAECGCSLTKLSRELSLKGISGYEGLVGIPGTVGGATVNNSGGFNCSMDKVVKRVLVLEHGQKLWKQNPEMGFGQRNSILKHDGNDVIVLAVELDISRKRPQNEIDNDLKRFSQFRKKWIDGKRKSLGSVFCASSLSNLANRHKWAFALKRILSALLRIVIKNPRLNVCLEFLFLGNLSMAKHCDSLNRFCWDSDTTEKDFYEYIHFMQSKAGNKMNLEIQIKR